MNIFKTWVKYHHPPSFDTDCCAHQPYCLVVILKIQWPDVLTVVTVCGTYKCQSEAIPGLLWPNSGSKKWFLTRFFWGKHCDILSTGQQATVFGERRETRKIGVLSGREVSVVNDCSQYVSWPWTLEMH